MKKDDTVPLPKEIKSAKQAITENLAELQHSQKGEVRWDWRGVTQEEAAPAMGCWEAEVTEN